MSEEVSDGEGWCKGWRKGRWIKSWVKVDERGKEDERKLSNERKKELEIEIEKIEGEVKRNGNEGRECEKRILRFGRF